MPESGSRIVLFGATGYTGQLIAQALAKRGSSPVLAARSERRVLEVADWVGGGLETAVCDADRPESIRELVGPGDVLVAAVGPFMRWGAAAVEAAVAAGACYLDIAGEPPFLRSVFERYGPRAAKAGATLLPAFAWESVPGNVAAERALVSGGDAATRIDVGYFYDGPGRFSGGSRASQITAGVRPGVAFRDGVIRTVRGAERYRTMTVGRTTRPAISVGACEHFTLPRRHPRLREVNVYIGDFGTRSRAVQALSVVGAGALRLPGASRLGDSIARRLDTGSSGGPTASERAGGRTHVVAVAYDTSDRRIAEAHLEGVDGYDFTAEVIAWGAAEAARRRPEALGAVGPVEAFGLARMESACAAAGIARVEAAGPGGPA